MTKRGFFILGIIAVVFLSAIYAYQTITYGTAEFDQSFLDSLDFRDLDADEIYEYAYGNYAPNGYEPGQYCGALFPPGPDASKPKYSASSWELYSVANSSSQPIVESDVQAIIGWERQWLLHRCGWAWMDSNGVPPFKQSARDAKYICDIRIVGKNAKISFTVFGETIDECIQTAEEHITEKHEFLRSFIPRSFDDPE